MLHKFVNENLSTRRNFTKKLSAAIGGIAILSGISKIFGKTITNKGGDSILDSQPFVGEMCLFPYNFAPAGWAACEGQLLAIAEYETLFNLIGTTYGGDGQSTFGLPDLRGRVAIHQKSNYIIGELSGTENTLIASNNMPSHNHPLNVKSGSSGNSSTPAGNFIAFDSDGLKEYSNTQNGAMNSSVVKNTGGSVPHNNLQPFLAMTYCISLFGVFPAQN